MQLHILYTLPHSERSTKHHIMCIHIYKYIYTVYIYTFIFYRHRRDINFEWRKQHTLPLLVLQACWASNMLKQNAKLNVWFVVLHFMSNTLQNAFEVCEYLVGRLARHIAFFLNIQCTQCALCFFWVCMYMFRKLHNIYMSISWCYCPHTCNVHICTVIILCYIISYCVVLHHDIKLYNIFIWAYPILYYMYTHEFVCMKLM